MCRTPSLLAALTAVALALPALAAEPEIPHTAFEPDNGLKVILHADDTVPTVAVNINYNVGSSDEPAGRTGFAHLFEHLMFMGTRRVPQGKFDQWMEGGGGWNNAWTAEDRTDFYDVGPRELLETLLWMEADRLQDLGPSIDQAKLDLQRDVVRNERRQTIENAPYGVVWLELPGLLYPPGHPYAHPVIGSHEDLQQASVQDVQDFFATWYAPRNASLVVAGDIDPEVTEGLVRRLFSGIENPPQSLEAKRSTATFEPAVATRKELSDQVHAARVIFASRTPAHFSPEDAQLDILSTVLASGKASRLYRSLVDEQGLAQDVFAAQSSGRLESVFTVWATAREGVDVAALEQALAAQLEQARTEPLQPDEVDRARASIEHAFWRGLDGVAGKAAQLNTYQSVLGDPDWIARDLDRYRQATPELIQRAAAAALDPEHRVTIVVVPEQGADEGAE